jgi:hypothetical protein
MGPIGLRGCRLINLWRRPETRLQRLKPPRVRSSTAGLKPRPSGSPADETSSACSNLVGGRLTEYEFTTGARVGAGCADALRTLSRGDGYYRDQDEVLRGILGLQGLSCGVGGSCDLGLACGRVGFCRDTLRGVCGGVDDSGVYGVRELLSGVWGSVQSGVSETLSFLF